MHLNSLLRWTRRGALLAASLLTAAALQAQAQYAGTYVGTINTRVTVPVLGTTESPAGGYIATVAADGTINLSGQLAGTVSASGAVTFTSGTGIGILGIRSAQITNNQLSSNYGDLLGNGTTQFRLNPSTSFTAAPGGGGGGGGGGSGTIDTPDLTQTALRGKTLTFTVTDGQAPFARSGTYAITLSASGNNYTLTNVTSTMVNSSGTYTYDNFGNPNGVIELRFTGLISGLEALPIGLRVQSGAGRFEFNRGTSGQPGFQIGSFTIGTTPPSGGGSGGGTTNAAFTNGSFEGGPNPGTSWATLTSGSTAINGWTITSGSIDYMGTAWQASDGPRSLDLSGGGPGAIAQTFATTAGTTYTVTFDFAGNPGYGSGTGTKSMRVSVNNTSNTAQSFTFDTTGRSLGNMGWVNRTFTFVASGTATTLTFTSETAGVYGPALDNVKVNGSSGTVGTAATAGAQAIIAATAPASFVAYRNKVNQTFEFTVTGATSGSVWGTDVYTDDSNVAAAAVHAGVLRAGETKTVTVTILPGQSSYTGSARNGITTGGWGAWTGSYSFAGAGAVSTTASTVTRPAVAPGFVAASYNIALGGRLVIPITVTGGGTYTYQWYRNNVAIQGATANPYVIDALTAAFAGSYTVDVTNSAGTVRLTAGTVTAAAVGAPQITLHPISKVVTPGGLFTLAVSAQGAGTTYQWFRNGTTLAGETGNALLRQNINAADAGTYTVRVSNSAGNVTSSGAVISLSANATRPANISVRTNIAAGKVVTPGFVVQGVGTKRVLIRAVGPGLGAFGVPGTMADPKLEVFRGSTSIATNDNWAAATGESFGGVGAFGLTPGSRDAAIVADLAAGPGVNYSVQVSGVGTSSGVVLIEVYDLDNPATATSKIINVSVLGPTGTGADVLILGFVIQGEGRRTLLIRGIGPKLSAFGVSDTVADPKLEVYDSSNPARKVLSNENWNDADYQSELVLASNFMNAFALDQGSKDAATLALLDPGAYSVQLSGADGGTGQALVEVYDVP